MCWHADVLLLKKKKEKKSFVLNSPHNQSDFMTGLSELLFTSLYFYYIRYNPVTALTLFAAQHVDTAT